MKIMCKRLAMGLILLMLPIISKGQWISNGDSYTSGKVGIGMPVPYDLLHIGTGGNIRLTQTTNAAGATSDVIFNTYRDADANFVGARLRFVSTPYISSGYPSVWKTGEIKLMTTWGGAETSRLTIKADGNVGINTESPVNTFQINDGQLKLNMGYIPAPYRPQLNWAGQFIGFNLVRTEQGWVTESDGANNGASMIMADPFGRLRVVNISSSGNSARYLSESEINQNTKFIITPSGSVGVGTTSLDAKLTVKGNVHAEEVKVDLLVPGPDYVFEPTYKLTPLDSVQSYINHNKHLPEVPSVKEMEANGINLSEMNMLLLKKIEELTLYQIQSNIELEILRKEIKTIKSQLK